VIVSGKPNIASAMQASASAWPLSEIAFRTATS
jgi:hypothetical protein